MADFKSRPGSFLPLLEYSQRKDTFPSAPVSPLTLLEILARQPQRTLPMFDLQKLSDMDPSRYGAALKSLRDAKFIDIAGDAPEQMIRLSDSGAEVARVARP